jgi:hypothetical protein
MTKKSMVKITLAVFSVILFSGLGVSAQADCSTPNDAEIVTAIYKKMKVKYKSQMRHVNVRSKEGVVTLEGWVTTRTIKTAIEKIAAQTKCVKAPIVNKLGVGLRTGCGPGQKKCGDICIPSGETCNICTARTCF